MNRRTSSRPSYFRDRSSQNHLFGYSFPNLPQPHDGTSQSHSNSHSHSHSHSHFQQSASSRRPLLPPYIFNNWSFLSAHPPPHLATSRSSPELESWPSSSGSSADSSEESDNSDEDYHNIDDDSDDNENGNDEEVDERGEREREGEQEEEGAVAQDSEFTQDHSTAGGIEQSVPSPANQSSSSPRPPLRMSPRNLRKRPASSGSADATHSESRPKKRSRKQGTDTAQSSDIPQVDLSGDSPNAGKKDPIQATLQKQREEQVRAQLPNVPKGKSKLTTIHCTVCLEPPTDLTATSCGHVFCRACLYDWLNSADRDLTRRPNCPACRKGLKNFRGPRQKDLVNLVFMKAPS